MLSEPTSFCLDIDWTAKNQVTSPYGWAYGRNISVSLRSLYLVCNEAIDSEIEDKYSSPMVLIGIYISIASSLCVLAMALDLLCGFRNRKFWFPCKYFSLNAASITVITVAMKLPVDLNSSMLTSVDQVGKIGGLAFMCTVMSNLMPSLASMDNKSLIANVTGLSILVITVVVNVSLQIRTQVILPYAYNPWYKNLSLAIVACIYMSMLLFLLIILISSAITLPTSKKILEFKYQGITKTASNYQNPQENLIEKLRQTVKRYWIMAETGSPQFVMASTPLSCASGIICIISMVMHIYMVTRTFVRGMFLDFGSVYKWSMCLIVITQFIGIVIGSIAPIFRCFTLLSFKSFANQSSKHFMVFKIEKYWTKLLCEWKESGLNILLTSRRSRSLLNTMKTHVLSFCISFQKVIIVSCKIIALIPVVVIIFITHCSYYIKLMKATLFTPPIGASSDDTNEDLSSYVLLLEDNMELAEKTMKRISDSMNRLIHNGEKKQHNNLLKLLEESVAFEGVETFDTDQVQSLLSVEPVNSWSLPIVSLTCIAIALPNISKDIVDNLLESVGEGILFTHLVEESLNRESVYVNIRRATMALWLEVEDKCKWLETTLKATAYEGKTPIEIINLFAHSAENIVNKFQTSTNKESMESENLPPKIIVANSMYRVAKTIIHTYTSNNLEIIEDELFTRLYRMIADILAASFTNIPQVITMKCRDSAIEKREASVLAAIDLLGRTTKIIKKLETHELPNMDPEKMGFIDEWRLHLKQP
ncbi:hypothetical protein SSX86_004605 [Deinandra increscens subsp. villosa]|uniref:Uncharacterized protein n=1 Tax=Deinandra increscens subsp. villosa TaxID=3103831 RepID=A0AAP0H980_9ASTR